MTTPRPNPTLLILSFAAVYLIWGSSFAASKLVVRDLPPLLASGLRFVVAGSAIAAVAFWQGIRLPRAASEWRHATVMAVFLILLSPGLNMIAMTHVTSSESALLSVSSAFFIPVLGALGRRGHPLGLRATLGLALGFAGVVFLMWPKGGFDFENLGWQSLVLLACLSWALGTLYYRRVRILTPPLMATAIQMLIGGCVFTALAALRGDPRAWHPTAASIGGLAFMTVFSSGLAYTGFAYLMSHTTPARLATYAYVNPVVAALVGWGVLGEHLSGVQLVGMAVILSGVVLVSLPDGAAAPERRGAPPTEATP